MFSDVWPLASPTDDSTPVLMSYFVFLYTSVFLFSFSKGRRGGRQGEEIFPTLVGTSVDSSHLKGVGALLSFDLNSVDCTLLTC